MLAILGMISIVALPSAECVNGSRDEPVLMISDNDKRHFIHMLKGEEPQCKQMVELIRSNVLTYACGCKQLIYPGLRDRIMLKCAYLPNNKPVKTKRVAIYYYFNDGQSPAACNRLRSILINTERKGKRW